jgi:16S rRNA (uracil1498-N3)-methyltransferase
VHSAFERTRPISGKTGAGVGVAGTNSGASAAKNRKPFILRVSFDAAAGTPARPMVLGDMPRDRFFIAGEHVAGERVALAPDDARKLVTVLRRQSGDRVQVVDGTGAAFAAQLDLDGKTVYAILGMPSAPGASEIGARIVLAQGIPKGQKMDFIVEKATELGVAAIVPLRSDRVTGERTGEHKRERWQRIARSAAQQAGRSLVPHVEPVSDWGSLRATFTAYERVYLPWERAGAAPLRERFEREAAAASSVLIVVGPEGGFSTGEVEAAQAAGALPISLGSRILRTETAALVVLAALLYARGDL